MESPLIIESQGSSNLNVDVLSKDIKDVLEKIRQSISENRNHELAERINSRLDRLAKEDYETLNSLRKQNAQQGNPADRP